MTRRWMIAIGVVGAAALIALLFFARAPAGTRAPSPSERAAPPGAATARAIPQPPAPIKFSAPSKPGDRHAIVRGGWGAGDGEFGHRLDPEAAPEGPMSLTVDRQGRLLVLDQINHRVQRFTRDGKRLLAIPIGGDTAQDLLVTRDGRLALLDRLGEQNVQIVDDSGHPLGEVGLRGAHLPEPGGVTGLYDGDDGALYAEREHGDLVRIAGPDGASDPARPIWPGRPSRAGRLFLRGAIADRAAGRFAIRAVDASGEPAWEAAVDFGAPILYVVLLDSDAAGEVFAGARVGRESATPPYRIVDERVELRRLGADGSAAGALSLDAAPAAEEVFREFTVADDGTIYRLVRTPEGVIVESIRFP